MNQLLSVLLVLILIITSAIPITASSFNENSTIETSEIGVQILDNIGHELIKTKDNSRELLLIFYGVLLCLFSGSLLIIALIFTKRKKGK